MDILSNGFIVLEPGMIGFQDLSIIQKSHTKRYLIDYLKLTLRPIDFNCLYGNLDTLVCDMVQTYVNILRYFDFKIDDNKIEFLLGGMNSNGYNRTIKIKDDENNLVIYVRYYESDDSSKEVSSFVRQGFQIDMSGNSCAFIRNQGRMLNFLQIMESSYQVSGSRIDLTLDDMVGKDCVVSKKYEGSITKRYMKLYESGKFSGRCSMNVVGLIENPSIYLGKMRGHKSLLIYDKLQEARDRKYADEPELLNVLKSMTRYEITVKNDKQDCTAVLKELLDSDSEMELYSKVGEIHTKIITEKCRFLKKSKLSYSHPRYYKHDEIWDFVVDNKKSAIVFASHVPKELTIAARALNFLERNVGGLRFCKDYIEKFGETSFMEMIKKGEIKHES